MQNVLNYLHLSVKPSYSFDGKRIEGLTLTFAAWIFPLFVSQIFAWHFSAEIKNNFTPCFEERSGTAKQRFLPQVRLSGAIKRQREQKRLGMQKKGARWSLLTYLSACALPFPCCLESKRKGWCLIQPLCTATPLLALLHAFAYTVQFGSHRAGSARKGSWGGTTGEMGAMGILEKESPHPHLIPIYR